MVTSDRYTLPTLLGRFSGRSFGVALIASLLVLLAVYPSSSAADPFPPFWQGGSGPAVHFPPVAWPNEPSDPKQCGDECGEWKPYTRMQQVIRDPRIQDPSHGGSRPQNYVNISSGCIDESLPSIYYSLVKGPTPEQDVLMFRWRVEQIPHTYATGPSPGSFSSGDPWKSAQWTVLFDIDGTGFRDLAAHIDGSSGRPATPVDMLVGVWGRIPTQSIDHERDPDNIRLLGHNPTAFVDQGTNRLLNFQNSLNPVASWPNGASETVWDYGSTRAIEVTTSPCNEYFVDYQIPVAMLDASDQGGPKLTRSTPISMLFCTANSLNNPFQKDCAINREWVADPKCPAPFGDYISFDEEESFPQPIVVEVDAQEPMSCPGSTRLTARVLDTLRVEDDCKMQPTVKEVDFYYWYDANESGMADDPDGEWVRVPQSAQLRPGSLNIWESEWDATGFPRGQYLIGAQSVDDNTRVDDGMTPSGVDNRTFSYLTGGDGNAIYVDGAWIDGQEAQFPDHSPAQTPGASENWYGNPDVTGQQIVLVSTTNNTCGVLPDLVKSVDQDFVSIGQTVEFTLEAFNPAANVQPITITELVDDLPAGFIFNEVTGGSMAGSILNGPSLGATGTLTWEMDDVSVAAGSSASLSFEVQVPGTTGTFTNTGRVTTLEFDEVHSNPVQVGVGAPRLSISKTVSSSTAEIGDPLTYTIRYSNDSPVNVTGTVITDVLPLGLEFVSATGGGSFDAGSGTITWNIGALAAGAGPFTVSYDATVADPYPEAALATLINVATIDSDQTDPTSDTARVFVDAPRPRMQIQKTAPVTMVAPGADITFTLSYANVGNTMATGVVISDEVPPGFTYQSASPTPTVAPAPNGTGLVSWDIGSVVAGGTGSVTVTMRPNNPYEEANPQTNIATIGRDGFDGPEDEDDFIIGIAVQACTATQTYYFKNLDATGLPGAVGLPVTDNRFLANQTQPTSVTPTTREVVTEINVEHELARFFQDPAMGSASGFTGQINATIFLEKDGGPPTLFRASVYSYNDQTGEVTQIGTRQEERGQGNFSGSVLFSITPDNLLSEGDRLMWRVTALRTQGGGTVTARILFDATNSQSRAEFCTVPIEVGVNKDVDALLATPGDSLQYTIQFTNPSLSVVTGAVLVDLLPEGLTFTSATLNGSAISPSIEGSEYTFEVQTSGADPGELEAGGTGTLVINAQVDQPLAPGVIELVNTATLITDQTLPREDTATTVVRRPELSLSKSVDQSLLLPGDTATYSIQVLNSGSGPASDIQVIDPIPSQPYYEFVALSMTGGDVQTPSGSPVDELTWTINSLEAGQETVLTYQMRVRDTAPLPPPGVTTLDNTATETNATISGQRESNTVTVSISTNPNLALTKQASVEELAPGETIEYVMEVTNIGSGDAISVRVDDPIPASTSFVAITQGPGSFDANQNRVRFDIGTLAPTQSVTMAFTVRAAGSFPAGETPIVNIATATAGNASSRQATATSTVLAEPEITLTKDGAASVPMPAATLAVAADNDSVLFLDATGLLDVGDHVLVNGQITRITSRSGQSIGVTPAVSAPADSPLARSETYSITFSNIGNAAASNVLIEDDLPTDWLYVSSSPTVDSEPSPGANGPSLSWSIGDLAVNASGLVQVTVIPTVSATNTAELSATELDESLFSSVHTDVGGLVADKYTDTPVISAGEVAEYTITVRNSLPTLIDNVQVADLLESGFTYQDGSTEIDGVPANNPAFEEGDTSRPIWTVDVPAEGEVTIFFIANTHPDTGAGTYQNAVQLTREGVGIIQFDELATTAEDVEIIGSDTGLVEGVVFVDSNSDGIFNPLSDTPLQGVLVTIIDAEGLVYVVYTDENGYFQRVVGAGTAIVDVDSTTVPGNLSLSPGSTNPSEVVVPDGGSVRNDTGYVPAPSENIGSIGGTVFLDNGAGGGVFADGIRNGLEPAVLGVEVLLRDSGNNVVARTYTNQAGGYLFNNVPIGDYTVEVNPGPERFVTTDPHPAGVTLPDGQHKERDFGILDNDPVARDDSARAPRGSIVTLLVLINDSPAAAALDPAEVQIEGTGAPGATLTVPSEGRWEVNQTDGSIRFIPIDDFEGDPTPIRYLVRDVESRSSNLATVTVEYEDDPVTLVFACGSDPEENFSPVTLTATVPGEPDEVAFFYAQPGVDTAWQLASGTAPLADNPVTAPNVEQNGYRMDWDTSAFDTSEFGEFQVRVEARHAGYVASTTLLIIDLDDEGECKDLGTPVVLAWLHARELSRSLQVEWATASEIGNAGFNLYGETADGQWLQLNDNLIGSEVVDTTDPQFYSWTGSSGRLVRLYLEDVDVFGVPELHGPFSVGRDYGRRPTVEPLDWNAIRQAGAGAGRSLSEWRGLGVDPVRVLVDRDGIYRLSYDDLAAKGLIDQPVPIAELVLKNEGVLVPVHFVDPVRDHFGPGTSLEFFGQAVTTLYSDTNVYYLERDTSAGPFRTANLSFERRPGSGDSIETHYLETVSIAREKRYNFASRTGVPWVDTRMLVTSSPKSWHFDFTVDHLARHETWGRLQLHMSGVTNWPDVSPDHHVEVLLNNQLVADEWFTGQVSIDLDLLLQPGLLREGNNRLTLRMPADTGAAADVVDLAGFSVQYARKLQVRDGSLAFSGSAEHYRVTGLATDQPVVYRVVDGQPERVGPLPMYDQGNNSILIPGYAGQADYVVAEPDRLLRPVLEPGRAVSDITTGHADYLMIAHPDFIDGLAPLVNFHEQQGRRVWVVNVLDVFDQFSHGRVDARAIQAYIQATAPSMRYSHVLLVGGDTYDYRNSLGSDSISFIPSLYAPTSERIRFAPADPLFVDLDNNGVPDLPIGRLPVRTPAELAAVIDKTLAYATRNYRRTAVMAADRQEPGRSYAEQSDRFFRDVSSRWLLSRAYVDHLGVAGARSDLINGINYGTSLTTYTGHSAHTVWSFDGLFSSADIGQLTNFGRPTAVVQFGCWNTYHVIPSYDTLGHRFLLTEDRGAALAMGSATFTDAGSGLRLGEHLLPLLVNRGLTAGQALTRAKQDLAATHPELRDVIIGWTILGDPALVVD